MKIFVFFIFTIVGVGRAGAQDACSSLSTLSDDPILRALQTSLGLGEESSLYQRCVLEEKQLIRYRNNDSSYFSDESVTDQSYRETAVKVVNPRPTINSQSIAEKTVTLGNVNENRTEKIDRLKGEEYRSVGIYGD